MRYIKFIIKWIVPLVLGGFIGAWLVDKGV